MMFHDQFLANVGSRSEAFVTAKAWNPLFTEFAENGCGLKAGPDLFRVNANSVNLGYF